MKRVLVTGPLEGLADYAAAARAVGWEAIELPLLRVVPHRHDISALLVQRFDWICLTSSNALGFLTELSRAADALRATPCAVVGQRSSDRARELGFSVELTGANASALGGELARVARPGSSVLWPRGHLSDELARELRERGLSVVDPVVYSTEPLESRQRPPAAEAIFFASPSAVRAWHANSDQARDQGSAPVAMPRIAVAIGETTFEALMAETGSVFFDTISLPEPTPEAFGFVLVHLSLGDSGPTP